jgi:hypothetical protein
MGSVGASLYRRSATHALAGVHLPAVVSARARNSVGPALAAARALPASVGPTVAGAAWHAFIRGLDAASLVGFGVAVGGVVVAWRFLPAGMTTGAPVPVEEPRELGLELLVAAEVDQ